MCSGRLLGKISNDVSQLFNVPHTTLMDLNQHFILKANLLMSEQETWLWQECKEHTVEHNVERY